MWYFFCNKNTTSLEWMRVRCITLMDLRKGWAVVVEMDLKWMTWKYHMADCEFLTAQKNQSIRLILLSGSLHLLLKKHCGISSKEHNYGNLY